jgi:hypothetical protein
MEPSHRCRVSSAAGNIRATSRGCPERYEGPLTWRPLTWGNCVSEGDLNTNPRRISPNRGFHADDATPVKPAASLAGAHCGTSAPVVIKLYAGCLISGPMRVGDPRLVIVIRARPLQAGLEVPDSSVVAALLEPSSTQSSGLRVAGRITCLSS